MLPSCRPMYSRRLPSRCRARVPAGLVTPGSTCHSDSSLGKASRCWFSRVRSRRNSGARSLAKLISSDLRFPFKIKDTGALELYAIAPQAAANLTATRRSLEGAELGLAHPLGPIWRQHAMRGSGYGVFGNPLPGGEIA